MKIAAYEVRPDEKPVIEGLCKKYGIDLVSTPSNLDKTTASMAAGCDGVTTLGQSDYCNEVLDELKGYGVQVLASRCVGYNHMNCDYARSLGFRLCNGAYAPNGVAEYTVMAILMCIRKYKKALYNTNDNDFTLKGKMGRELRTMTVGVMGTGKIGFTVIKCLSGFGCRILANDVYENDAVRQYAEYVMDIDAVTEAVESGKFSALFMDAFPGETGIIHVPHDEDIIHTPGMPYFKLKYLRSFVNVYHTPHMAFFTEEAAQQMAECGVDSIYEIMTTGKSRHEIPC